MEGYVSLLLSSHQQLEAERESSKEMGRQGEVRRKDEKERWEEEVLSHSVISQFPLKERRGKRE